MYRRRAALIIGIGMAVSSCGDSPVPPQTSLFDFRDPRSTESIRLEISKPEALSQADSLLASGQPRWVIGTPRAGDGGFNSPWHWHLDPETLSFAEVTAEACQTLPSGVEQNLDYWINFGQACIWGIVEST